MTISSIGSSNYYMGPMAAMGNGPDRVEIFNKVDEDEDGSLNETEAQSLAEIISPATGEEVDVTELLAASDTDEDGVFSEEEAIAALEANRPQGPPPEESAAASTEGTHSVLAGPPTLLFGAFTPPLRAMAPGAAASVR